MSVTTRLTSGSASRPQDSGRSRPVRSSEVDRPAAAVVVPDGHRPRTGAGDRLGAQASGLVGADLRQDLALGGLSGRGQRAVAAERVEAGAARRARRARPAPRPARARRRRAAAARSGRTGARRGASSPTGSRRAPAPGAVTRARPTSAQHRSRRPLVQTRTTGDSGAVPSWGGVPRRQRREVEVEQRRRGRRARRCSSQPAAGWAARTARRVASWVSACRPGRRIRTRVTPAALARASSSAPSARSRCEADGALRPQGPGCSRASQALGLGAVAASGSSTASDSSEQASGRRSSTVMRGARTGVTGPATAAMT